MVMEKSYKYILVILILAPISKVFNPILAKNSLSSVKNHPLIRQVLHKIIQVQLIVWAKFLFEPVTAAFNGGKFDVENRGALFQAQAGFNQGQQAFFLVD